MKLTDTKIKAQKPAEKPYKLFDGKGLYLLVNRDGSRWWRLKYRYGGKEKLLALGTYPAVGLKKARDRASAAHDLLTDGIDPSAARKAASHSASRPLVQVMKAMSLCALAWSRGLASPSDSARFRAASAAGYCALS